MPCDCSHMEPNEREVESRVVLELLREVDGKPFDHEEPKTDYYGKVDTLDADEARLCAWCKTHNVKKQSLELQLWWRRHQKSDAAKERAAEKQQQKKALARAARAKLTPAELKALRESDDD